MPTTLLHVPPQLVIFRVGATHYAFDIEAVDEILPLLPVTPAPGAPAGILGLADVRRGVVPVFDLHWKFNVPADTGIDARLVLVGTAQGQVAMLVDAVEEVATVSRADFERVSTPGNGDTGYLSGVVRRGETLVLWLDHEALAPKSFAIAAA